MVLHTELQKNYRTVNIFVKGCKQDKREIKFSYLEK